MVTKSREITVPETLGIFKRDNHYVLQLQRNLTVQVKRIESWIVSEKIVGIDLPRLCKLLQQEDHDYNQQVPIAESLAYFDPSKESLINVQISDDELTAYLSILDDVPSDPVTVDDCLYALLSNGVKRGFRRENIAEAIQKPFPVYQVTGAKGAAADPGEDSEIILHEAIQNNHSAEDDKAALIEQTMVVKNEVIAQKLPLKQGKPGYTVTGKMLVNQVFDQDLPAGENTYVGEDKLTLFSAINGYLEWDGETLAVRDILRIDEDVDYRVGDITYHGRIVVDGDIRAGVTVAADKDVEIMGCVEGGSVISKNGDVIVHRGINGLEKSRVTAGGDIVADYIQDAVVSAGGRVLVKRYVARSLLDATEQIIVHEREGLTRGGVLWSEQGIHAKIAGSSSCMTTVLGIRPKLTEEDDIEINRLQNLMEEKEQKQHRLRRRLDFLSMLDKRQSQLSQKHQNEALLLSEQLINTSEEIVSIEDHLIRIQRLNADKLDFSKPLIRIEDRIFPGVKFVVEDEELLIQQELGGADIRYVQGKIVLNTLDE